MNTVGTDNVSTSEEEIETKKPAVPPRTRATYDNGQPPVIPRRHLNNKEKTKGEENENILRMSNFTFFNVQKVLMAYLSYESNSFDGFELILLLFSISNDTIMHLF